jgi:CheY-like chemotaxis protein
MGLILIVDDQIEACRPLQLLLKHLGHRGVCVTSGEDALAYLRTKLPDLLILDVMMPGMDGIEVLRRVRAEPSMSAMPVVMFSAVSDPGFMAHAREKGATDYWVKASMGFDQVRDKVTALLPQPGGNGSASGAASPA